MKLTNGRLAQLAIGKAPSPAPDAVGFVAASGRPHQLVTFRVGCHPLQRMRILQRWPESLAVLLARSGIPMSS